MARARTGYAAHCCAVNSSALTHFAASRIKSNRIDSWRLLPCHVPSRYKRFLGAQVLNYKIDGATQLQSPEAPASGLGLEIRLASPGGATLAGRHRRLAGFWPPGEVFLSLSRRFAKLLQIVNCLGGIMRTLSHGRIRRHAGGFSPGRQAI
jgi:hypothetical protein